MSMIPVWGMQQAIYAALQEDAGVQALIGGPPRIYDAVPEDAVFPFLTIGEARVAPVEGTASAFQHTVRFHAWSRYEGQREIKEIVSAIHKVMSGNTISVAGERLVSVHLIFSDMFRRPDLITWHATMRYRMVTQTEMAA